MGIRTAREILQKVDDEVVIKNFDFAGNDLADGEAIAEILSVTTLPTGGVGDLAVDFTAFSGTIAQVTFSLGRLHTRYEVKVRVRTTTGQILDGCGFLEVEPC